MAGKCSIDCGINGCGFCTFLSKDATFTRNRIWLLSALIVPGVVLVLAMPNFVRSIIFTKGTPVEVPVLSIPLSDQSALSNQNHFV
nr:hypothetical protein [uncultured Carboxylicivirga sp.]